MKTNLVILFLLIALLNINCSDDELIISDPYYTDLQDTLVFLSPIYNGSTFMLDLDKDNFYDAEFKYFIHESQISPFELFHKVTPLNGYEINISEVLVDRWSWDPLQVDTTFFVDTFKVAIKYDTGDTIRINSNWTSGPIMLYYSRAPRGSSEGLWNSYKYGTVQSSFYYIAFRKNTDNLTRLAWIRLKNFEGITLNSSKYQDDEEMLIIK